MQLFPHKTLEQSIIEALQNGPLSTHALLDSLLKKRAASTKQGMYAALRKLVRAEIVIKQKRRVLLNVTWLNKVESFVTVAEHFYANDARSGSFLALNDGERITYTFNSANATDAFWTHVLLLLVETYPGASFIAYNPHCWFLLVRTDSERALRDTVVKKGGQYLVTTGGRTPLDTAIRKEFDGTRSQYHMREKPLFPRHNYYVNVIGDYVIEVWVDKKESQRMEELYASAKEFSPDVEDKMRETIHERGRTKLVISKNRLKALAMRKKLGRSFHIVPEK